MLTNIIVVSLFVILSVNQGSGSNSPRIESSNFSVNVEKYSLIKGE